MKRRIFTHIFFLTLWINSSIFPRVYAQGDVVLNTTPMGLYTGTVNYLNSKDWKGETFCWNAAYEMNAFVNNYLITRNTQWLDAGVLYYDYLIGKMDTGPDGYKGWIGPYMYDDRYWCDSHVGDAILLREILDFSVLVLEDNNLKIIYEAKANSYVEIAKKHLIEKWDKRGTWKEDGKFGAYVTDDQYMAPGNLTEWKYGSEVIKSGLSHPYNKQNDIAQVCIRLYRITGDKFYFDKAEKIFLRMKSQFQYFDNHYVWNYWEPFGPWDIDLKTKTTVHWVNVHPYRNYQDGEVSQIVDAYHNGIVFDSTDIQRIINTNLEVMWNKDTINPFFYNSNITHTPPTYDNGTTAGTLWTGLVDFSQKVRDLYGLRFIADPTPTSKHLYFDSVICKTPPDFKRKFVTEPVVIPKVNFSECSDIYMAQVIPNVITKGVKSIIINKSWNAGEIEIALYSEDGQTKIKSLYKGINSTSTSGFSQIFLIEWDGTDPDQIEDYRGNYLIRWTLGSGYRDYSVTIVENTTTYNKAAEFSDDHERFLKIYPNPCHDKATIAWDTQSGSSYLFTIYNLLGLKLREYNNLVDPEFEFQCGDLNPGIYFLTLKGEKNYTGYLVIQ